MVNRDKFKSRQGSLFLASDRRKTHHLQRILFSSNFGWNILNKLLKPFGNVNVEQTNVAVAACAAIGPWIFSLSLALSVLWFLRFDASQALIRFAVRHSLKEVRYTLSAHLLCSAVQLNCIEIRAESTHHADHRIESWPIFIEMKMDQLEWL